MGEWNHFKITQTIPKQYTRKVRNQGMGIAHILWKVPVHKY